MKTITNLVIAAAAVVAALGCNTAITLTDGGRLVHTAADADLPAGCTLIGDVAIGHPPDAARPPTQEDLVLLMRNKAADHGANYVVVDSKEERGEVEKHWVGRARAYRCPDDSGQGATSGGADFGQVGPAEGAPADIEESGDGEEAGEESGDGEALGEDLDI